MAAFGENLRREREMRGVSLEEISAATKISVRFLQAIEEEDFAALPGGVFARSFIRTYARYLGLDEERVMAEYQLAGQPSEEMDLHRLVVSKRPSQRSGSKTTLLALLVAGVLLAGAYVLFRYSRRSSDVQSSRPGPERVEEPATKAATPLNATQRQAAPSDTSAATPPAVPASPPGAPAGATSTTPGQPDNAPPAGAGTTGTPSPASGAPTQAGPVTPVGKAVANTTGLVLQVAATEPAWVGIDADGESVLQRVLKPNEVQTLKARDSFDVTTGNASGIILTLNGETLKPLGRRGEVKSIHLTRDDVKNPAP